MADAQIVTQAAAQPVNWLVVGFSSAVVSAAINTVSNWLMRLSDRKREDRTIAEQRAREDAVVAERRAHQQLDIALMLEAFAQEAFAYLYRVHEALARHAGGDERAFDRVDSQRLEFVVGADRVWTDLPVGLAAKVRELPNAMAANAKWIGDAWITWADSDDAYELEKQRAIHYGWLAFQLADEIRRAIAVPPAAVSMDYLTHFSEEFEAIQASYEHAKSQGQHFDVIPEMEVRLLHGAPARVPTPSA
ncbi:hypothetical protein G3N57_00025 [Paraburkholderia sp. Se-20369]|nr:hypothetical protein [Paraburkholderia sp. Se-20369]